MLRQIRTTITELVVASLLVSFPNAKADTWEDFFQKGLFAREQGHYKEAQHYFEAVLSEARFDARDIRRAELNTLIAGVSDVLGESAKAERLYLEAKTILDSHENVEPTLQCLILSDLGSFHSKQGRLEEAEAYLKQALAVASRVFGEGDARTASNKANLGRLYTIEGRLADAEGLLVDAVRVHESVLPAGHPDRIASENGLAALYATEGRSASAELIIQKVSKAAPQLGDQHPLYAASLMEIAGVYRLQGRPGHGEPLLRKALAIYETSIGPDCPPVAYTLLFISIDALSAKEPSIAENHLLRALNILRKTNGPDHPMTAVAEYRLAQAYSLQMKYAQAERLLKHALAIQERIYPNGQMAIADTLYGLAEVEAVQRRYTDAEWNYQRAISIYENVNRASPSLAIALQHYAKVLRIKRTTEAKALERRATELEQAAKSLH